MGRAEAIDLRDPTYAAAAGDAAGARERLAAGLARGVATLCDKKLWREGTEGDGIYIGIAGVVLALRRVVADAGALGLPDGVVGQAEATAAELMQHISARHVHFQHSFLEGQAGVNVLKAFAVPRHAEQYAARVVSLDTASEDSNECELLYGRAGYLYALLCLLEAPRLGGAAKQAVRARMAGVLREIHTAGTGRVPDVALMYEWYGQLYMGLMHGVAGICYVLLQCGDALDPALRCAVKQTALQLAAHALPDGNYPAALRDRGARLNQVCHGAPGFVMMYCRAYEVFGEAAFLDAARRAAASLMTVVPAKGVGLCHGPPGAAYALLRIYRTTRDAQYLAAARHLALFCADHFERVAGWSERPMSLFEGVAGLVCLLVDLLVRPEAAVMPGVDVLPSM